VGNRSNGRRRSETGVVRSGSCSRRRRTCLVAGALVLATATSSRRAEAYPTAVIFVPTGDAQPAYNTNTYVFGSVPLGAGTELALTPWVGTQLGLGPSREDRTSDSPLFGGFELGVDALGVGDGKYKLVVNAKVQLLAQWRALSPDLAIGMMQLAPFDFDHSVSLAYAVASWELRAGQTELGRLTLGYGHSIRSRSLEAEDPVFHGSFPFSRRTRSALLMGYSSPAWGRLSLSADHFGGYSEASSLNFAVSVRATGWLAIQAGPYFGLDRRDDYRSDGAFANAAISWDLRRPRPAQDAGRQP